MAESGAFYEKTLNITSLVPANQPFHCFCGWSGLATELAKSNDFSCCPACGDFDIRMPFEFFEWSSN
jgi:hypothetical protein